MTLGRIARTVLTRARDLAVWTDRAGNAAVEYALLTALVAIAMVASLVILPNALVALFNEYEQGLQVAASSGGSSSTTSTLASRASMLSTSSTPYCS